MWLEELENELKEINYKIDIQHKKTKESIQHLQDLYVERENITNNMLHTGGNDE